MKERPELTKLVSVMRRGARGVARFPLESRRDSAGLEGLGFEEMP
jgi:hypothetical protein